MIHIKSYTELITEKSSLNKLGIPTQVMKIAQRDLSLPSDLTWNKISTKKQLLATISDKNLYVTIETDSITFVIHENGVFLADIYVLDDKSEWSGTYKKMKRKTISKIDFLALFSGKAPKYELLSDFNSKTKKVRDLENKNKDFEEFTTKFKHDFITKFDSIYQRFINNEMKNASKKAIEAIEQKKSDFKGMINSLKDTNPTGTGLTILDEKIMTFEDEYSEYFGEHTDILELSKLFTYDKMLRSFMLFVYTGNILK